MSKWPMVHFTDYVHVYQPETIALKHLDSVGPFPVFGANGRIGVHSKYNHEEKELLLGCRGSVGSVNWSEPRSWINGNAMVVRPDPKLLDREFVAHLLAGGVDLRVAISGTAQPQITRTSLQSLLIPLPPLDEQKRIVAKLDQASGITLELGNSNRLMQARLQFLSTSLVDNLISGDHEDASLKEISDVFVDGDWIESKDQSVSGIRLIQTGNIGQAHFRSNDERARYISSETFTRLNCTEVRPGDVLISRLPDPVGRACLIPDIGSRMITAVDCTVVRPSSALLPQFLVLITLTSRYRAQVRERISGTTRDRISRKNLGEIRVPVPTVSEQKEITQQLDTAREFIRHSRSIAQKRIDLSRSFQSRLARELLGGAA